eukprot:4930812-Amphidinium_carterae.1
MPRSLKFGGGLMTKWPTRPSLFNVRWNPGDTLPEILPCGKARAQCQKYTAHSVKDTRRIDCLIR